MRYLQFPAAGQRLRELRNGADMTIREMAPVLGVATSTLAMIERGKSQPSLYMLMGAARFFGVPLTELTGDSVEGIAS